jgi:hypothetical protein
MFTANIVRQYLPRDSPLEDVVKSAFDNVHDNSKGWMLKDDDSRLLAATGALLIYYKDDTEVKSRIESELTLLRTLSAAATGVSVNFDAVVEDDFEPVGLLQAYNESKERSSAE